jgi:hypothetical protein
VSKTCPVFAQVTDCNGNCDEDCNLIRKVALLNKIKVPVSECQHTWIPYTFRKKPYGFATELVICPNCGQVRRVIEWKPATEWDEVGGPRCIGPGT